MSTDENRYDVVMHIKPVRVAPGASVRFMEVPYRADVFYPAQLIIPDEVAPHFFVVDFKVGRLSQLNSVGALPAELFAESGPGFELLSDPIRASDSVNWATLEVQSMCDRELEFSAQVLGSRGPMSGVRKTCLGMGNTTVAAEGAVNVCMEPQRAFRPTHLFLPSDVAPNFEVQKVFQVTSKGRTEHVVESIPDLAERDQAKGSGSRLIPIHLQPLEMVEVSLFLIVAAVNLDGKARQFKGAIVGDPG